jgi:hypothetical protein
MGVDKFALVSHMRRAECVLAKAPSRNRRLIRAAARYVRRGCSGEVVYGEGNE